MVGCIAGAVLVKETRRMISATGLVGLEMNIKPDYIDSMTDWNDKFYRAVLKQLPAGRKMSNYITSLNVSAREPLKG